MKIQISAEFETKKIANLVKKNLEKKKTITYKDLVLLGNILTVRLTPKSAGIKNQNEIMTVIVEGADSSR